MACTVFFVCKWRHSTGKMACFYGHYAAPKIVFTNLAP